MNENIKQKISTKASLNLNSNLSHLTSDHRGITLVALIITMIIMLILVGVTINIAINGGLFGEAKEAVKQTAIATYKEKLDSIRINLLPEQIAEGLEGKEYIDRFEEEVRKDSNFDGSTITRKDDETLTIITKEGYEFEITEEETKYIGKNEGTVEKPEDLNKSNTKFIYEPEDWTNGVVKVKIETETKGNTLQYSLDGENWTNYIGEIEVEENGEIYARLKDSTGKVGDRATGNVTNIDRTPPTLTLNQTNTITKEYQKTISVNAKDDESGISVIKYASGNRDKSYFVSNGIVLSNDTFNVTTTDYIKNLRDADLSNIIYTVYTKNNAGSDSIETITIQNLLIDYQITGNSGLVGGTIDTTNGNIEIPANSTQTGPYCTLPAGTYEITYSGTNLNNLIYSASSSEPNEVFHEETAGISHYTMTLSKTTSNIEIKAVNNGTSVATITGVRIRQIDADVLYSYGKQNVPFTDEFTNYVSDTTDNYINFASNYIELVCPTDYVNVACTKLINVSVYKNIYVVVNKYPVGHRYGRP